MMKKLLLPTLVTLLLAVSAGAAELTETVDKTFDVRPGAAVSLDNVNGGITIGSWDQPRVRVIAHKKVKASKHDVQEAMRALKVEMLPANGGLTVNTRYPRENRGGSSILDWMTGDDVQASVKYEVTVPRNMNLDVSTVNGSVRVTQVSGKHELETTNGKIEVERCSGSLDASTTNGGIDAELTQVTKGQPLRFSTTNGKIEVSVPASLAVDVDASTTNGSIESDLPVATTKVSRNSLRGSINGGGTPLRLRTTNGGIEIKTVGK
jgi:Putative adhesin